ncbi:MAG: hypothetical protein AAF990_09120 [Bacteroidota bacterium]
MDYNLITALLEKYWEGNTSLEEEQQLRAYFNGADVAPELLPYQPLFQFFKEEKQAELPADFESRLSKQLQVPVRPIRRVLYRRLASAAAILLLAFVGLWMMMPAESAKKETAGVDWSKYECANPEDCLEQVQTALLLVSGKLNKGTDAAAEGLAKIETATSVIK